MDPKAEFPTLIDTLGENDEMFAGNPDHYFAVGRSALSLATTALRMAGRETCASILDLPCGHGRVMRYFKAAFPDARITGCDLNGPGVDFCAKTFGAIPVHSRKRIQEVSIADRFDLIWCGSLLTHIEEVHWEPFISFFAEHLVEAGVMLFTTHGRLSVKWIRDSRYLYGIEPKRLPRLLADYNEKGFGYAPYPGSADYGTTLSAPSYVLQLIQRHPELRVVLLNETGWDNHQDVYACMRVKDTF